MTIDEKIAAIRTGLDGVTVAVAAGATHNWRIARLWTTGTTAASVYGLY